VSWYDPHVAELPAAFGAQRFESWSREALSSFDVAVIVTAHAGVDHALLVEAGPMIVDTRNALRDHRSDRILKL
jgi:UDP-N-acetyl-D-mannosaminuronate dehydrogenase